MSASTASDSTTGRIGRPNANAAHSRLPRRRCTSPHSTAHGRQHDRRRSTPSDSTRSPSRRRRRPRWPPATTRSRRPNRRWHPPRLHGLRRAHHQKLIMWPMRPWKHSCSASDMVGWVCTLRASSLAVRSHFCARVSSGSSSETSWPDQVAAQQLAVLGVGDELDEAARVAHAVRLGVGGERELGHLDVVTLLAGLLLGEPEAGDLGLAERRARQHAVVAERPKSLRRRWFRPPPRPGPRRRGPAAASR